MQRGILLVNLGTPDAPEVPAVRRYLRGLLDDPRVLVMPRILRWLLVHLVIAPFRAPASTRAYRRIWTPEGSPLLVHGRALEAAVQARLPGDRVRLGMQVGQPSIASAVAELGDVDELVVLPLYPQYASATVGGALAAIDRPHRAVPPFFGDTRFLDACASRIPEADHVVFSFHGLPLTHVPCIDADCEAGVGERASNCYRSQCYATARGIAARLPGRRWSVSFQSRLGRGEWLSPYTSLHLRELAASGVKRIAVACPSFVADCLETLYEIGIEEREALAELGTELVLVPSLNAGADWVEGVVGLVG